MFPSSVSTSDRPGRGIAFMMLAVLVLASMDALIKYLAAYYPVPQIVFFRAIVATLVVVLVFVPRHGWVVLRAVNPMGHAWRWMTGFIALMCFFYSFALLPLADAYTLGFAAPLIMTALSVPLLGEKVGWRRWTAIALGFAGVLVVMQPGAGMFGWAALLPVVAAGFYALALIAIRKLSATETNAAIVFYFGLASAVAAGAIDTIVPGLWVAPDLTGLALLCAVGLLGALGQLAITEAFRAAPVSVLGPFDYSGLLFAVLYGWLFWNEIPGWALLYGAPLIVASGLYILYRETRLALKSRSAPLTPPD